MAQKPQPIKPNRTGNLTAPERAPVILSVQEHPPGETQTVVEFPAIADAYIASNRPNDNFGAADGLFLGYNIGGLDFGAERILLRYDLSGNIPAEVRINSAHIRLYLTFSNPAGDLPMGTVLRRLASPWGEYSVTWNSEPSWGGIRASPSIGSSLGWYEWDVTSLVAGWVKGTYPNYGVEIIGDERVRLRERAFYARETITPFYPRLVVDYTTGPFDDEPPEVEVEPLPSITPSRQFTVRWSGSDRGEDPSGIDYYDVQYRIDSGDWQFWLEEVTFTEHQFTGAESGRVYLFRARGVDKAGNAEEFGEAEAQTTVDYAPPITTVDPLPFITKMTGFVVSWRGTDGANEAGIYCYDVQYRYESGPWTIWQPCTTATSAIFSTLGDGRYQFEARAVDNLGFLETFKNQGEAITIVDLEPPFVEVKQYWLPLIFGDN